MRTNIATPSVAGAVFDTDSDLFASVAMLLGASRFVPGAVGQTYIADTLSTGTRTTGTTFNQVVASPMFSGPDGFTIDQWTINVTTAVAASTFRIGAWKIDDQSHPFKWSSGTKHATLAHDAGTIDTSTTGGKTLADSFTFQPNTWYLIGGATQGATGAQLTIGNAAVGAFSPYGQAGSGSVGINVSQFIGLAMNAVAGTLGDFTPNGGSGIGHGVALHRSA